MEEGARGSGSPGNEPWTGEHLALQSKEVKNQSGASLLQQAYRKEPDTSLFAGLFFRGCLGYSQMRKTQKEENIPGPNRSPDNNCLDSSGVTEG